MTTATTARAREDELTYLRHWRRDFACDCPACRRHLDRLYPPREVCVGVSGGQRVYAPVPR